MSGILGPGFHEGNRSEYLANYLLSGLGIVNPVPRQNDTGYDFYCQLSDEKQGVLSFDYPFLIQVKSDSESSILYGKKNSKQWRSQNLEWIARLQTPFLIGFVSKKEMKMDIYTTSGVRFLQIPTEKLRFPNPSLIELKRRAKPSPDDITSPKAEKITPWPRSGRGDGKKYVVDLGNPILTLTNDDLFDKRKREKKKRLLRKIVRVEQENILFRNLKVPHIYWAVEIKTNQSFKVGQMFSFVNDKKAVNSLIRKLAPSFISVATSLISCGEHKLPDSMKPLLKRTGRHFPTWVKNRFPQLTD